MKRILLSSLFTTTLALAVCAASFAQIGPSVITMSGTIPPPDVRLLSVSAQPVDDRTMALLGATAPRLAGLPLQRGTANRLPASAPPTGALRATCAPLGPGAGQSALDDEPLLVSGATSFLSFEEAPLPPADRLAPAALLTAKIYQNGTMRRLTVNPRNGAVVEGATLLRAAAPPVAPRSTSLAWTQW